MLSRQSLQARWRGGSAQQVRHAPEV